ncbi:hypothetical protein A1OQ_03680 [Enterovibrio norvegicus FF-162]|uniref:hypothetical protein n=1 Tax=Enterovibrio norvegicus TaxID=188144 RepID=UPI0003114575|nr:hypothetical protein [Enterovibrio norvegicus]OEE83858.1 hypothetical protein A1OQ_03680 [Enterovibrio norvegicus FF-162]
MNRPIMSLPRSIIRYIKNTLKYKKRNDEKIVALEKKLNNACYEIKAVKRQSKAISTQLETQKSLNNTIKLSLVKAKLGHLPDCINRSDVDWFSVFNEEPKVRVKYWEKLYQDKEINLATELKHISCIYLECVSKIGKLKLLDTISLNKSDRIEIEKSNDSNRFSDFIKGKCARILGPTEKKIISTSENTFTVGTSVIFDKKVDIAYYSSFIFREEFDSIVKMLQEGNIKFAVVNRENIEGVDIPSELVDRIYCIHKFNRGFDTHLLGIQRAIYDLVTRGVEDIKIEGVNFYTKLPYHNKDYKTQVNCSGSSLLTSWSIHDLVFNFQFMKTMLNKSGLKIEVQDECSYIFQHDYNYYTNKVIANMKTEDFNLTSSL